MSPPARGVGRSEAPKFTKPYLDKGEDAVLTLLTLSRLIGTIYVRSLSDKGTVPTITDSTDSLAAIGASWMMHDEAPLPERSEALVIADEEIRERRSPKWETVRRCGELVDVFVPGEYISTDDANDIRAARAFELAGVTTRGAEDSRSARWPIAPRAEWLRACAIHWSNAASANDGDFFHNANGIAVSACPLPANIPSALVDHPITWREPTDRRDPRKWDDAEFRRIQNRYPRRERRVRETPEFLEAWATAITGIEPTFESDAAKIARDESNWYVAGVRTIDVPAPDDKHVGREVPYIRPNVHKQRPCRGCNGKVEQRGDTRCRKCSGYIALLVNNVDALNGLGITRRRLAAKVTIIHDVTHGRVTVRNASTGATVQSFACESNAIAADHLRKLVPFHESQNCHVTVQKIRPAERWLVKADYRTRRLTVRLDSKLERAGRQAESHQYATSNELTAATERVLAHFAKRHIAARTWKIPAAVSHQLANAA